MRKIIPVVIVVIIGLLTLVLIVMVMGLLIYHMIYLAGITRIDIHLLNH